jgi:uncharacterized protein (TIGR02466 family)
MDINDDLHFIEYLFPTPVYVAFPAFDIQMEKEFNDAIDNVTWVMPTHWENTHMISNTFSTNEIENHNLLWFKEVLDKHLRKYCEYLKFPFKPYKVKESWFSKFENGDYGHAHSHGWTDISGVYYIKTNGEDGNLRFQTPNLAGECSQCFDQVNLPWDHKPMVGKLVLFPGWLKHGINPNNTEDTRISFAFNINFER